MSSTVARNISISLRRLDAAAPHICHRSVDSTGTLTMEMQPDLEQATRLHFGPSEDDPRCWDLKLSAETAWAHDLEIELQFELPSELAIADSLWPLYDGMFERHELRTTPVSGTFHGGGLPLNSASPAARLALPFVVAASSDAFWLVGCDPEFSSSLSLARGADGTAIATIGWRWLAAAGPHPSETRRIFIAPTRNLEASLDAWFHLATPDVPAGPAWLHDIALQDYDFLSRNGQGWYADIDAAAEFIAPADRHRALFCLHGWYDQIGRYCFDAATGTLDDSWIAFPHVNDPRLQVRSSQLAARPNLGVVPLQYRFRNLDRYHPVPLTWDDVRDRLRYAKDRGFRTGFYVLTGLQAAGDREQHIANGTGLDIHRHLWTGPELIGPTYIQNPLHPDVRANVLAYIQAILERVGDLSDALVLDESYYIGYGAMGPAACPGYADRAQLRLVKDIASLCHTYRPDLAFLSADHIGTPFLKNQAFPYSLAADGIYHDAFCWPTIWDACRFPTWRNVAWSCNWTPASSFGLTCWAVLGHNAPIALSNGCFGDDIGLADMEPEMQNAVAGLWQERLKNTGPSRTVTVVDSRYADRESLTD